MTSIRHTRSMAALAAASLLALTACGSGDDSSSEETSSASSSESSEESPDQESDDSESSDQESESADESSDQESDESESPETSESAQDAAGSEGAVNAKKSGVSFELPKGWETFDPKELLKDTSNAPAPQGLKDMAKAQGVTVDQLVQNMAQSVDVMAMGETDKGFTDNVNVIPSPQPATTADLKTSYEQQGGKVTGTDDVKTSAGTAPSVTYTMSAKGLTIHGQVISVPTDSGSALITVSASDPATTKEAITTIADSVKTS